MIKYNIKLRYDIKSDFNIPINQFKYQYDADYSQVSRNIAELSKQVEEHVAASMLNSDLAALLQQEVVTLGHSVEHTDKIIIMHVGLTLQQEVSAGLIDEYLTNTASLCRSNYPVNWIDHDDGDQQKDATHTATARLALVDITIA